MIKNIVLSVIGAILFLVFVMFLAFGSDWMALQWHAFIGPQKENVERNIFENTKSYRQGMTQQLLNYRSQYMLAKDPADKAAIAGTVAHMFADFDPENLDPELRTFLKECKYNQ